MSASMSPAETQRTKSHSVSKSKSAEPSTPASPTRSHKPPNPLHLLPATALFHGPHSRNASHSSLNRQLQPQQQPQHNESGSRTTPTEHDKTQTAVQPQHLPRANPPTSSFSSPRAFISDHKYTTSGGISAGSNITTPGTSSFRPPLGTIASSARNQPIQQKQDDDFHPDAVWAEMQRTLADVELSAMNSSHVFGATHARALEDLRAAQLGLAQAWAKSEADEMGDEEFGKGDEGNSVVGTLRGGVFGSPTTTKGHGKGHSRNASTPSNATQSGKSSVGNTLEEETERDIKLARRRREANDRYFKQVNRGVLEVVKKLDEVAGAMRRVEKESREIWNESSGSEDDEGDLGTETGTEGSVKGEEVRAARKKKEKKRRNKALLSRGKADDAAVAATENVEGTKKQEEVDETTGRRRAETMDSIVTSGTGTESEFLTDSPVSKR